MRMRRRPGYMEYYEILSIRIRFCPTRLAYSLPRKLNNQAISSSIAIHYQFQQLIPRLWRHVHITKPALFFFMSSVLSSSTFSSNTLPVYWMSRTMTGSSGLAGLSLPQTSSTRFFWTARRPAPPFFLILSSSLLASAVSEIRG